MPFLRNFRDSGRHREERIWNKHLSDRIGQSRRFFAAVGFVDVAHIQHAGDEDFAHHLPLVQRTHPLHRNANAVHDGQIVFLTAADQRALLAGDVLAAHHQRVYAVNDALDLRRNGIPIDRHGEYQNVRLQNSRGDGVEIIVKRAGLAGGIAGLAGVAAAHLLECRVKARNGVALGLRRLNESVRHRKTVSVFAGTAGDHNDFLAHARYLLCFAGLTFLPPCAIIIT